MICNYYNVTYLSLFVQVGPVTLTERSYLTTVEGKCYKMLLCQ